VKGRLTHSPINLFTFVPYAFVPIPHSPIHLLTFVPYAFVPIASCLFPNSLYVFLRIQKLRIFTIQKWVFLPIVFAAGNL
jgi:hypothetical protein